MTYNVFSGTLNPTQSIMPVFTGSVHRRPVYADVQSDTANTGRDDGP